MTVANVSAVNSRLKRAFLAAKAPIVDLVAAQTRDPFRVLLGTILSARTKDACTAGACQRLFAHATTPAQLRQLPVKKIEELIYPVGFFRVKARMLKELPAVIERRFGGRLPETVEELCELPGVGRKTANLVVALGFEKPAICVDVHVHRIVNRLGLIATRTPFESEMALRRILPVRYWRTWNSYLVSFGQTRCLPRRPRCEGCPIGQWCDAGRTSGSQAKSRGLARTAAPAQSDSHRHIENKTPRK